VIGHAIGDHNSNTSGGTLVDSNLVQNTFEVVGIGLEFSAAIFPRVNASSKWGCGSREAEFGARAANLTLDAMKESQKEQGQGSFGSSGRHIFPDFERSSYE